MRVAKPGGADPGGAWTDRFICEVLLREAEALILDPTFPADPFDNDLTLDHPGAGQYASHRH
jgi:hypothetical protein